MQLAVSSCFLPLLAVPLLVTDSHVLLIQVNFLCFTEEWTPLHCAVFAPT